MPWNGPINGDYSNVDFSKAPWQAGLMTLTHEEVVYVKEQIPTIVAGYEPQVGEPEEPSDFYVQSTYNRDYSNNWEKAVNGETFAAIKAYDPEVQTEGIGPNIEQPLEGEPDVA